ncbi:MAG: cyclic nucleotide-binding domain-containing protein [Planctomycetes bacterium]|nr:cyclic nucleotide-binding domain-containing protein [Planctomycetota bacterium]
MNPNGDPDPAAVIRELKVFQSLGGPQVEALAGICREVRYPAGSVIFREGDAGADIYVVLEGRVALGVAIPGGPDMRFLSLGPGDFLGWSAFLPRKPKMSNARATEPARLLSIDGAKLRSLCDQDHDMGYRVVLEILSAVSSRLQATRLQLIDMYRAEPR